MAMAEQFEAGWQACVEIDMEIDDDAIKFYIDRRHAEVNYY